MLITISCAPATFTTAAFEFAPAQPMLRPSDSVRESDGRPPCMLDAPPPVPPVMPPESPLVAIPGMIAMMPVAFLEVGIAAMMSLFIVVCTFALWTSTIGVSPVTVIVFCERADFQIGVDRRDERAGQLDAFALHRAETGQRERDGIGAGPQIDDSILAGVVADDGANFFDERGAGGFHRDAGHHGARRVLDDPGDGPLGPERRGNENQMVTPPRRGPGATLRMWPPDAELIAGPCMLCGFYCRTVRKSTENAEK